MTSAVVLEMLLEPTIPVLLQTRAEDTILVVLRLNRLAALTPFTMKVLLVSRLPFAQIGRFPNPAFAPVPPGSSAFTPGERIASPVKLPVGSGMESICAFSG